jgi:hypothetical protein
MSVMKYIDPLAVDCCRTLVATLPRDYAATADPYLGHTIGPITSYGVSRIRKTTVICSMVLRALPEADFVYGNDVLFF